MAQTFRWWQSPPTELRLNFQFSAARVFPNPRSPTAVPSHRGWSWTPMMWRTKSRSWERRVWRPPRSVCVLCTSVVVWGYVDQRPRIVLQASSCVTRTESPRCVSSTETRSCASWSRLAWSPTFPRICTTWSRRLLPSASIWSATARTRTASSVWFWSSPESTAWPATTRLRASCPPTGSTSRAPPPPWWPKSSSSIRTCFPRSLVGSLFWNLVGLHFYQCTTNKPNK